MPRQRKAPSAQPTTSQARSTRQALKEKTNIPRMYSDDGSAEGLVENAKSLRGRPKKVQQNEDEYIMTGALPNVEDADEHAAGSTQATTDPLAKSDTPPAATKANRRPPRTVKKVVPSEGQTKLMDDMRRRMAATAQGQRTKQKPAELASDQAAISSDVLAGQSSTPRTRDDRLVERSEFSLSPSPPRPGKLSAVKNKRASVTQPGSVLKVQSTPAVESSMLALKNFKRRARQPSMLQMVQQRTAGRPSVGNALAAEDSSVFDLDLEDHDDEEDFAPEAEGTPVNPAKAKRKSAGSMKKPQPAKRKSESRTGKRKSDAVEINVRETRRRKVDAQEDHSTLPSMQISAHSSLERRETPQPPLTSDVQVAHSPTSTPPTDPPSPELGHLDALQDDFVIPSTEKPQVVAKHVIEQSDTEEAPTGTMIEPVSSSPVPEEPSAMQRAADLIDPATQVSPERVKPKPKPRAKPASTATLQALLPKRRQALRPRRRKTEYDMEPESEGDATLDASHLEEDEDELGGRLRRRTKAITPKRKKTGASKKGVKAKAMVATKSKPTGKPGRKSGVTAQTNSGLRTYGRAVASDKENDGYESLEEADEPTLPDVSLSMQEAAQSKELEEAKRKFADVDGWDMEFESMSAEDHRSSSQGWR